MGGRRFCFLRGLRDVAGLGASQVFVEMPAVWERPRLPGGDGSSVQIGFVEDLVMGCKWRLEEFEFVTMSVRIR